MKGHYTRGWIPGSKIIGGPHRSCLPHRFLFLSLFFFPDVSTTNHRLSITIHISSGEEKTMNRLNAAFIVRGNPSASQAKWRKKHKIITGRWGCLHEGEPQSLVTFLGSPYERAHQPLSNQILLISLGVFNIEPFLTWPGEKAGQGQFSETHQHLNALRFSIFDSLRTPDMINFI